MKFTWGHAITLVFILFAGYILYFVYQSFQTNVDLVAEDYYAREVAFQDRINETANAVPFKEKVEVKVDHEGILITFPKDEVEVLEGSGTLFRPSSKDMDRKFPITLNEDHTQRIPKQALSPGRYSVQLEWKDGEKGYFISKDIVL